MTSTDPGEARSEAAGDQSPPAADVPLASRANTVRRNALSGYLPLLVSTALGIFLTPVFVHALSKNDFGVWSVGLGLIAYLGILDAGVGTAVVTRIGHAKEQRAAIESVTRAATAIYLAMGLVGILAALGLAWAMPSFFPTGENSSRAQLMILFLGLWQVSNLLLAVPSGALQGSGRYSTFAVYAALSSFAMAAGQAIVAVLSHNIAGVALATAFGGIAALALSHRKARAQVTGYTFSPRGADRRIARSLFRLGWRNAVVFIAGAAGYGSDIVIVGLVAGAQAAAIYTIASRAGQFAMTLGRRATDSLTGSYASLVARGQLARAWRLYHRGIQTSLLVYLPLAVVLVGFGRQLLVVWVGHIGAVSYPVLVVIVVAGVFQVTGNNAFILIIASENGGRIVPLSVVSAAVNLGISIALTSRFGAVGAAYGSLVSAALIDGLVLPIIASRICNSHVASVWRPLAGLVVPTACAVVVCALFRSSVGEDEVTALIGSGLTVCAFALGCFVTPSSRSDVAALVGRRRISES